MKKIAIVVIICMLALIVIVSITIRFGVFSRNSRQSQNRHTFSDEYTEDSWKLLWEKQNLYLELNIPRNQFIATMNTLCYVAPEEESSFHQESLVCIDIHDGKQKWIGQADYGSSIASDEKQVYVGGLNNLISAYNAETGQKIWHQRVDARNITRVAAYDGFVSVEASPDSSSIFDASNGSLRSRDSVPIMSHNSFANDGNARFENGESHIYAYDIQDNSLMWDAYFENTLAHRPVFSNGLIIVRAGQYRGTIQAIDSKTGGLLWEKEGVVSDFGINDKMLFFVTTQGEVLAVDAETGETQGRLMLNDAELNAQEGAFASYSAYFVRAVDDIVLVYLGDTGQLFSFQYSNE